MMQFRARSLYDTFVILKLKVDPYL